MLWLRKRKEEGVAQSKIIELFSVHLFFGFVDEVRSSWVQLCRKFQQIVPHGGDFRAVFIFFLCIGQALSFHTSFTTCCSDLGEGGRACIIFSPPLIQHSSNFHPPPLFFYSVEICQPLKSERFFFFSLSLQAMNFFKNSCPEFQRSTEVNRVLHSV